MKIVIDNITADEIKYLSGMLTHEAALGQEGSWQLANNIKQKMYCEATPKEIADAMAESIVEEVNNDSKRNRLGR